jgi:phospholipid/cholesterol/gamma-HCH transport system substrate-binding protein
MSRAFRLGLFVIATLLVLGAGVYWIGAKQFMFSHTYQLAAEFQNAGGLVPGSEVRVGGIHQGTVRSIVLPRHPTEKVRVQMELQKQTRDVVKKDSVATIKQEGMVGDRYVEISFGSEEAPKVNDRDVIQGETPQQMADLMRKADSLLDSVKGATENVASITQKIDQGQGTMGKLVNDKRVYQNMSSGATAFQENMEALKHNFFLRGFYKKRGYEDSSELKKHEISRLPSESPVKGFEYPAKSVFEKDDAAKLKDEKQLDEAGKFLQENEFGLVVVAAYMDKKGDAEKDRTLSEARAMVVRDYLVKNFKVDDTRIKTIGLGKSSDPNQQAGVDILVYPRGTPVAENRGGRSPKP